MIKKNIIADIKEVFNELELEYNPDIVVEIPKIAAHGDYSTNAALKSAHLNKMKPRELAEILVAKLKKIKAYKKIEIAGPGFINFILSNSFYLEGLNKIQTNTRRFLSSRYGKGRKIILEFVSANPTGPLNVVSARAATYGDTLYRIFTFVGFKAFREYYMNDAGNQVDILAESIDLRYREILGEEIDEFPPEAYHGEYVIDLANLLISLEGDKIYHMSEKDRLEKMKNFALDEIHKMQVASLQKLGVEFENWMSEKKLREEGAIEEVLSYLAEANCTYEKDEAIWFESTLFGDEKDRVLMRQDGTITYIVPDIAYHLTKYHRKFDYIIDVLGPDHHGYVPRLLAALTALKYDQSKLEIVYLQHINLIQDGKIIKMSKRAGKIVTMDELVDEVGKDAARFFFINRKPSAHLNFDLELAKKQTADNPVFYVQYAHARIYSILKKARAQKLYITDFDAKNLKKLSKDAEIAMIRKMMLLPELLINIAETREPHRLATYVHQLAGMFHKYYANYKILGLKDQTLTLARLYMISSVKNVIATCLELMGISAPKQM